MSIGISGNALAIMVLQKANPEVRERLRWVRIEVLRICRAMKEIEAIFHCLLQGKP